MKISIIVIAYNEEKSISGCINSILDQTYNKFELILVNDGSTDKTKEVIKQFEDKRIIYAEHSKKKGYASARNTGLGLAKGEYVFFTDADCIPQKDWIENGLRFIQNNPDIIAASGITKGIRIPNNTKALSNGASYIKALICYVYYFPSTINSVYKRKILKEVGGFDERYNCGGEDADMGFRVMRLGRVKPCENMIVLHKAKPLTLGRILSLIKRASALVCFVKDHGKYYPKLKKSRVCYGFIAAPYFLLPLLFPPLVFLAVRSRGNKLTSLKDMAFLIPFYLGLWYIRFIIWKTAFKEKIFLV